MVLCNEPHYERKSQCLLITGGASQEKIFFMNGVLVIIEIFFLFQPCHCHLKRFQSKLKMLFPLKTNPLRIKGKDKTF